MMSSLQANHVSSPSVSPPGFITHTSDTSPPPPAHVSSTPRTPFADNNNDEPFEPIPEPVLPLNFSARNLIGPPSSGSDSSSYQQINPEIKLSPVSSMLMKPDPRRAMPSLLPVMHHTEAPGRGTKRPIDQVEDTANTNPKSKASINVKPMFNTSFKEQTEASLARTHETQTSLKLSANLKFNPSFQEQNKAKLSSTKAYNSEYIGNIRINPSFQEQSGALLSERKLLPESSEKPYQRVATDRNDNFLPQHFSTGRPSNMMDDQMIR